jgi:hypothetical protein
VLLFESATIMMAEMCEVICLMALPVAKILSVVDE